MHSVLTNLIAATVLSQTPPPSADFANLLSKIPNTRSADPKLMVGYVDIAFAPTGDFTAKAALEVNGKVLKEFRVSQIVRQGTLARLTFRATPFEPLGPENGKRSFIVYVNDSVAGRLDFNLTKQPGGDAYAPTTDWTTTGPWQTHSYLTYTTKSGDQQRINFNYYLSSRELGSEKNYKVDLVMRRGTTILAKSLRSREVNDTELVFKEEPLHLPNGNPLMRPDLEKIAGPFILEIKTGSRVIRTYRGEIASGMFKPHKNSALTHTEPTTFLTERRISEGGGGIHNFLFTWLTTD